MQLFPPDEVPRGQVGFAVTMNGKSLVGVGPGDWRPEWVVIGQDTGCGDPIFASRSILIRCLVPCMGKARAHGGSIMIPLENMSDEDFERHALAVLQRELGLDGLARFFRLYRSGTGDYTRERHRWLGGTSIREIMAAVERRDKPAA